MVRKTQEGLSVLQKINLDFLISEVSIGLLFNLSRVILIFLRPSFSFLKIRDNILLENT